MAARHPAENAAVTPACDHDAAIAALARAVCALARQLPGGPASMHQILAAQLKLGPGAADAVLAAAERPLQP